MNGDELVFRNINCTSICVCYSVWQGSVSHNKCCELCVEICVCYHLFESTVIRSLENINGGCPFWLKVKGGQPSGIFSDLEHYAGETDE